MSDYSQMSIEELQAMRAVASNKVASLNNNQHAIKIMINALYGSCSSPYFRYFDVRIAEAITTTGQLSIKKLANRLNLYLDKVTKKEKDRVVLIDTDSVVLDLADIVDKHFPNNTTESTIQFIDKFAVDKMQGVVEKTCLGLADYINAYAPKLRAKKENIVDCMVSVSKKRYFMSVYNSEGVQYKEPKMKVMGLQMVKSSTPAVIRQVLRDSLKTILYGSEADVQEFCKKVHEDFRKFSCSEIAFPRGVNDIHKYHSQSHIYSKGAPIHVRGSLLYNYYLKEKNLSNYPLITDGDKIKFVYLKMPNPIKEDVISFIDEMPKELGLEEYIDYELMFQKTFLDAIQNILDSMRWSATPKATLDDLFDWS